MGPRAEDLEDVAARLAQAALGDAVVTLAPVLGPLEELSAQNRAGVRGLAAAEAARGLPGSIHRQLAASCGDRGVALALTAEHGVQAEERGARPAGESVN